MKRDSHSGRTAVASRLLPVAHPATSVGGAQRGPLAKVAAAVVPLGGGGVRVRVPGGANAPSNLRAAVAVPAAHVDSDAAVRVGRDRSKRARRLVIAQVSFADDLIAAGE